MMRDCCYTEDREIGGNPVDKLGGGDGWLKFCMFPIKTAEVFELYPVIEF